MTLHWSPWPARGMAHWGVAMTLFQPLWPTRPGLQERQRGWDALQAARKLSPPTERELFYIATAEAFFADPESQDYWLRIRRWERAALAQHRAFPEDDEAAVFYALAHLAVVPPDLISRDNADEAAAVLLRVYERNRDHPGAMHYLVHANDVPGRENELLEITRKYEAAAPRNPHALAHMQREAIRPQRLHHPHHLMPRNHRQRPLRQVPFDHMQIRPTDPATPHPHQHLPAPRLSRPGGDLARPLRQVAPRLRRAVEARSRGLAVSTGRRPVATAAPSGCAAPAGGRGS